MKFQSALYLRVNELGSALFVFNRDFSCKWRVELEVRHNAVVVSTVNVHHLCNVDVLRDFIWRLCWAGWNRNTSFSNFSMSLFGVLSSTPTGSELQSASLVCSSGYSFPNS